MNINNGWRWLNVNGEKHRSMNYTLMKPRVNRWRAERYHRNQAMFNHSDKTINIEGRYY